MAGRAAFVVMTIAATSPEFIGIPEWSRRVGVSKDSAYKAARLGQIPGCFAIGRLYRVNWLAFVERSGLVGGEESAEEVSRVLVSSVDHMGVHAQRHGGIGVAQPTRNGADVATGGDQHAGTEVTERMKGELRQPLSLAKASERLAE
jgi:hypothetical protein